MIDQDILDGDLAIFQRYDFPDLQHGKIVVVERIGEEEGFGSWALKKIVIKRPRSSFLSEYGDEVDWKYLFTSLR
jgi:SOS-response transcriptional repressor LexA